MRSFRPVNDCTGAILAAALMSWMLCTDKCFAFLGRILDADDKALRHWLFLWFAKEGGNFSWICITNCPRCFQAFSTKVPRCMEAELLLLSIHYAKTEVTSFLLLATSCDFLLISVDHKRGH